MGKNMSMTVDVDSQTFIDQAQNKIWFYIENLAFCEYDILYHSYSRKCCPIVMGIQHESVLKVSFSFTWRSSLSHGSWFESQI